MGIKIFYTHLGRALRAIIMKKQRNTTQKKVILDALCTADHPTATELFESVHAENPRISKATVFRVLSQYAENGEIRRVHLRGTDERYDATTAPHAHVRCAYCGKICDVVSPALEGVFGTKDACGFRVYSAEVDFVGCCPDCAAAGRDAGRGEDCKTVQA